MADEPWLSNSSAAAVINKNPSPIMNKPTIILKREELSDEDENWDKFWDDVDAAYEKRVGNSQ